MNIYKKLTRLSLVGCAVLFYRCSSDVNTQQLITLPVADVATAPAPVKNFDLPTPDSLAIKSGSIKCGQIGRIKYCGYAKAIKNDEPWKGLPRLTMFFDKDKPKGNITVYIVSPSQTLSGRLYVNHIPLTKGNYSINSRRFGDVHNTEPEMHFHIVDICTTYATYVLDSTKHSFVRVLDFDPQEKVLKMRFRAYFKLVSAVRDIYPESIVFDDGVVLTKHIPHRPPTKF